MYEKNQKKTYTKISRRSMLKGAAAAAVAGMIPFKMNDAYAAVAPDNVFRASRGGVSRIGRFGRRAAV